MSLPDDPLLRLSLVPGIGPRKIAKLLGAFGSPQAALAAPAKAWEEEGVQPGLRRLARSRACLQLADRVRHQCDRLGLSLVALTSPAYPSSLLAIHDPPSILYVRGSLPAQTALSRAAAIVGTRKPSSQGLAFTHRIAGELAQVGAVIVSGLALGIDAEAHRATVRVGGIGIAVLPGGLDSVHPPVNSALAEQLCERGCLVSEQPPGSNLRRGHFVGRNRIISGLSRAVLVVEAGQRSGALLTAEFAAESGRTVFAMPGRPGDFRVVGSLALLRDGAMLALSSDDIALELGLGRATSARSGLSELGAAAHLLSQGSASFDSILHASGLSPPALLAALGRLELAGRVRRGPDGHYYLLEG
jgi:DNA processing protein